VNLLIKLLEEHGPSGNEGNIRNIIRREIKPYVSEVYVDKFGNVVARKKGKGVSVMLTAHMDEIGIMVKTIDPSGKIFISAIGGIDPITLLGEKVRIKTKKGDIFGVITNSDIHDSYDVEKLPDMAHLYIDCGLKKSELENIGIKIGDYVYVMKHYTPLGKGDIITGKAMDDRVGCYVLLEVAKKLKSSKAEIYYVFTVQEEIGLYGAKTSVYSIDPDYSIVVDVTNADESSKVEKANKKLGSGPTILVKDAEMIANKSINDMIFEVAKKLKINLQPDVSEFGTTDALNISVSKGGIPSTVLGVAVRNLHTTTGVTSLKDIKDLITLLTGVLKNPRRIGV